MTTRRHSASFNRTASGIYLRQAEAALSLREISERCATKAEQVRRVELGSCTLYQVAPVIWQRKCGGKIPWVEVTPNTQPDE